MIIFTITTINVTLKYAFHISHNHKIWISNVNVLIFNFKNHLFHLANGVFFYLFHLTFWHNLFPTITVSHSHTNTIPYITKSLSMSMSSWISHNSLPHLTIWILNKCRIEFIPHITNINVFVNFTQITVAKRGGVREKIDPFSLGFPGRVGPASDGAWTVSCETAALRVDPHAWWFALRWARLCPRAFFTTAQYFLCLRGLEEQPSS